MSTKYILLNGPPRAGKDTAAKMILGMLREVGHTAYEDKLSAPIKQAFAATVDADINEFVVGGYEEFKERVIPIFGVSFRQWQIDFSEKFMKPLYGTNIFSKLLLERATGEDFCVVSDCGFQKEADYLSQHSPCYVINIHRQGATFEGDSREWVSASRAELEFNVKNYAGLEEFRESLHTAIHALRIIST